MVSKTYYQSFVKDNTLVIGSHILVYLKGIILMPIIIKTVGVSIYGGFVLLTSMLGIAFGISSVGAGFKARRFMPSAKGMTERRNLFYPQFIFTLLSILFFSLLFILLGNQINSHIFKNDIIYSIWIVPFYLVTYLLYSQGCDYFRYTSRVQYMTLAMLCFPYLHIAFVILYYYATGSITIDVLVITISLSSLLIAIPSFWVVFREVGLKFSFYTRESLVTDIKIGFPLVLGFILDFILAGSDRYIISFFLTISDVGYYTPGYVLGSVIILVPKAMGTALPQILCRAADTGSILDAHTLLNYAVKFFLLLAIPFVFGSIVLAKPMLTQLANTDVSQKAFLIVPVVALGTIFYGLNIILSTVLFVRQKTTAMFKINALAAIFNLIANMILFYLFRNIIVAAITTLLSYFIAFVYSYNVIKKEWPIDYQFMVIAKSVVASTIMCAILAWFSTYFETDAPVSAIAYSIVIGIIVYSTALFTLRTFETKEICYWKSFFKKC